MKIISTFTLGLSILIVTLSCKKEEPKGGSFTFSSSVDSIPPSIALLEYETVVSPYGTPYIDAGAIAEDDTDGDISSSIISVGVPDGETAGIYEIAYNVSDAAGNTAFMVTRSVSISYTGTQLAGNYAVVENCPDLIVPIANYDVSLVASGANYSTLIFNFADVFLTDDVIGTISGNTVTIAPQNPILDGTYSIQGTGTITKNSDEFYVLDMSYSITADGEIFSCTFVATQQ